MARGNAYTKHLDLTQTRSIYEQPVQNWDFLYEVSSTQNPEFNIGDVVTLPGAPRRTFVYAKSSAACLSGQGCETTYTGLVAGNKSGSPAIGDMSITIGAATHDAVTLNQLRGGFIIIHYTNGVNLDTQVRGIVGNDASGTNAALTVYMDAGLTTAPSAGTLLEVYQNPFASVRTGTSPALAKLGMPAAYVDAANKYFFVQVEGPTWAAPQSTVGENGGMGCFWRHDGSLQSADTALAVTTATYDSSQYAGHCLEGSAAGNGPLFNLQG